MPPGAAIHNVKGECFQVELAFLGLENSKFSQEYFSKYYLLRVQALYHLSTGKGTRRTEDMMSAKGRERRQKETGDGSG